MDSEIPISSLSERLQANSKFKKIPQSLQKWCIDSNINDARTLVNYLCLQAQDVLKKGARQVGYDILNLAEDLAIESDDDHIAAQIGAWLGLLESDDRDLVLEIIEAIREVITSTAEYKQFEKQILGVKKS